MVYFPEGGHVYTVVCYTATESKKMYFLDCLSFGLIPLLISFFLFFLKVVLQLK